MDTTRIMGLDVGDKTIGVALSDALGWTAQGLKTLSRSHRIEEDIKDIEKICQEHSVEAIVVGLPRNMNGTYGPRAEMAREFASTIKDALGLPVALWDERLTTVAAERVLIQGDLSRKNRKKVIDQVAASLILQNYMDARTKRE